MPGLPLTLLVLVGVGSPAVLFALLGGASLLNRPLPERWTSTLAAGSMLVAFVALSAVGNFSRWNWRRMQPSTRGLLSDEPEMFALATEPLGLIEKLTPTLPLRFGSWACAIS